MRERRIANPPPILKVHKSRVEDALEGVATKPKPQRRGRSLAESGEKHAGGDDDEGQVPHHIQNHDGPRIGAIDAAVAIIVVVVVGAVVGAVGEEHAAAVGGDEASEGEGKGCRAHGVVAKQGIIVSSRAGETEKGLLLLLFLVLVHIEK